MKKYLSWFMFLFLLLCISGCGLQKNIITFYNEDGSVYQEIQATKIDVVSVKRMINSDASNRVGEEVIICNY